VFTQVEGAPQAPPELQVDTALSEPPSAPVAHSVVPGVHTPWHVAVPTGPPHAWFVHWTAVPQVPCAVQVSMAALPEHCVWPGPHDPPQEATPFATRHVWFVQVEGVPQAPAAVHVATALIGLPPVSVAHSVAPGVHTPWHWAAVLLTAAHAWLVQEIGTLQLPVLSHTWMAELPAHCELPVSHVPWQEAGPASATHEEFMHATAAPQFPLASQVCTPPAEHWVVPGTHCPWHAPPTHAEFTQATGDPYVPVPSHVSTPLFEQTVAVGVHDPTHTPLTQA
jgi:hypothetical protein